MTLSASQTFFIGSVAALTTDGNTLLRLRGRLSAFITAATAIGDGFQGAFGIGIATDAAIAVGSSAVNTPLTEQNWDGWLYWTPLSIHALSVTGAANDFGAAAALDVEVDSKAMRKLDAEDAIYAMIEVVEEGTATADVFFDSRVLLALA